MSHLQPARKFHQWSVGRVFQGVPWGGRSRGTGEIYGLGPPENARRFRRVLLSCLMALALPVNAQQSAFVTDLDTVDWGAPGGGNGFPVGVQTATLGVDPASGGVTYYARFPAGSQFDLHWHTHAEYVAVLRGRVTLRMDGEYLALEESSYVVIPGEMAHSWHVPDEGDVYILVRRAGPADFNFLDESSN